MNHAKTWPHTHSATDVPSPEFSFAALVEHVDEPEDLSADISLNVESETEAIPENSTEMISEPIEREASEPVVQGDVWQIVGLRLPNSCMVYRVGARLPMLRSGDPVVIDTRHGEENGTVIFAAYQEEAPPPERLFPGPVLHIKRVFNRSDHDFQKWRQEREIRARVLCKESIRELGLGMKLSKVTFLPGGTKAIFYFTAENRVDFRELVRILARHFQVRVEMRQIGVRDETRLLSGLGPCGQIFCCAGHLEKFHPVSVRMAKNQELSLNPDAISGVCGRLMCCLGFENDLYRTLRGTLPKVNCLMRTRDGREVQVRNVHPIRGMADVQYHDEVGGKGVLPIAELSYINPEDVPINPGVEKDEEDPVAQEEEPDCPATVQAVNPGQPEEDDPIAVPEKEESAPGMSAEATEKRRRRRRTRRKKGPEKQVNSNKTAAGATGGKESGGK
ncbi:MAG: hypothetical protein HQL65_08715 [Magnetococcales bacterium]|nr:hypothetical protein [Magnetococcales bacterium]